MTETADELSTPLGQKTERAKRRFRLPFTAMQALAVLLGLFLLPSSASRFSPTIRSAASRSPASPCDQPAATDEKPAEAASGHHAEPAAKGRSQATRGHGDNKTVTIIDGSSGKRRRCRDRRRWRRQGTTPKADGEAASTAVMAGIDSRLLEKTRYGMIPMVADGLKPFTVYAAEADRAKAAKMPVVAIVVGGLGVGAAKTVDAIMKLPPAVTLAFTPYGADPDQARRTRPRPAPRDPAAGPDGAVRLSRQRPRPADAADQPAAEQNIDRLYWHLSRIQGYAGIANFMGARFVATDAVMQPFMREAAKRGLGYLDDGTTPRSVAGTLAAGQAMPFAKADFTIDSVPTSAEIDRTLIKLENTGQGTRAGGRRRLGPADLDRADRGLDQDPRSPRHHACAIDNGDAEIKI